MIIDRQNQFSTDQAITADAISENVIDLGPLGGATANTIRDIGAGKTLYLHILVKTALTDADGTPTLTITLESDDVADLSTSPTVHHTITAVTEAAMVAGYWIAKGIAIPAGAYQRYLGLRYTTNSADFDGGTVDAWLSENRYDDRTYENAWSTGVN
jgi:hypothetical protein